MANLNLDPKHLDNLARYQDEAATPAGEGAKATQTTGLDVWFSHGVTSGLSNARLVLAEVERRKAAENIKQTATNLAAFVRAAKELYTTVDEELGENLDTQMLDR